MGQGGWGWLTCSHEHLKNFSPIQNMEKLEPLMGHNIEMMHSLCHNWVYSLLQVNIVIDVKRWPWNLTLTFNLDLFLQGSWFRSSHFSTGQTFTSTFYGENGHFSVKLWKIVKTCDIKISIVDVNTHLASLSTLNYDPDLWPWPHL